MAQTGGATPQTLPQHGETRAMIVLDERHVLYIEPTQPASTEPMRDELTEKMESAFAQATPSQLAFRGFHVCVCGKTSSNRDYFLHTGQITNSLAVHYLERHRAEVPESELEKVRRL